MFIHHIISLSTSICVRWYKCKSAWLTRVHSQHFEKISPCDSIETLGAQPCVVITMLSMEILTSPVSVRWWWQILPLDVPQELACTSLGCHALWWSEWRLVFTLIWVSFVAAWYAIKRCSQIHFMIEYSQQQQQWSYVQINVRNPFAAVVACFVFVILNNNNKTNDLMCKWVLECVYYSQQFPFALWVWPCLQVVPAKFSTRVDLSWAPEVPMLAFFSICWRSSDSLGTEQ